MQERLDKLYDEITDIENAIEEVETRLYNIRQDRKLFKNVFFSRSVNLSYSLSKNKRMAEY